MLKKITKTLLLLLALLIIAVPAFANEATDQTLTLDNAIKKALSHNKSILNAQLDIDSTEIQRDSLQELVKYTPIDYNYNQDDTNVFKSYYGVQHQLRQAQKKLNADKMQLSINVTEAYHQVIKNNQLLDEMKANLTLNIIKRDQVKAKYDVGMATMADLLAADAQVVSARANIKDAEGKLDTAYGELNKITGQNISARPKLEEEIGFYPEEFDVDMQVTKAINNSFEIWSATEAARTAAVTKYFEFYSDIGNNNQAKANNTVESTKEEISVSTVTLCNGVKTLEANYQQIEKQIEQLEENLRVLKLHSDLGLVTKDNMLTVESNVKKLKNTQLDIASRHTVTLLTLKKLTGDFPILL
ncbi:TolC family protein [Desulforamulus aquiferis]|uniref:TolC family protein n=1 Tax=Desulforamulus aquiferis TaxID=1397668 RepID=A0AAW7ZAZ3_9FIRM|nr:TolC family protein [Desulforamulus aquiferis]MDO7786844.1 TolC family protein [Desulforamulus aquiferis]